MILKNKLKEDKLMETKYISLIIIVDKEKNLVKPINNK